jgi:hypothetical protein
LVTIVAGVLGLLVAFVAGLHGEGHSTGTLRVIAGLVTAILSAVLGRFYRAIPREVLASVLREQNFVAVRIVHALVAVAAGAWITIFPGPVAMVPVGAMLVISALILVRVGLFIGR